MALTGIFALKEFYGRGVGGGEPITGRYQALGQRMEISFVVIRVGQDMLAA